MAQTIRLLLPVFPKTDIMFFIGYVIEKQQEIIIYVTKYSQNRESKNLETDENLLNGYFYNNENKYKNNHNGRNNIVVVKYCDKIRIKKLTLYGKSIENTENCIIMLYEYNNLKSSETISDNADYFLQLQSLLNEEPQKAQSNFYEPIINAPHWLSSSMLVQHVLSYFNLIYWLTNTVKQERRISIKPGNLILAIITDIALGYFVLELITQDKKELSTFLKGILERLVNFLYSLLKWLMGSPAGLKLNHAFNTMLGKYFSYHIHLWWLFLDVTGEKLVTILHLYHYIGYLGITFQAAMISDMISLATFHSYCIYVYAARLFNIQVSGLIALLRLFVGRKYNPLRGGIDSCEYTNQELFVGTVAFTILLLLLPTTAMYYIVFTLFRLLSIGVQYILSKSIYMVQTLPLYVISLWLLRSPRIEGDVRIEVESNDEDSPLLLRVKLYNKSLKELINKFKPPVEAPKSFEWASVLSNVIVGKQIT